MTIKPRQFAPGLEVKLTDGITWRLNEAKMAAFERLVFYRGLPCPVCKTYLGELEPRLPEFSKRGFGVISISMDTLDRAQRAKSEWGVDQLLVSGELSIGCARDWELFIAAAIRDGEPAEFSEPGPFLIASEKSVLCIAGECALGASTLRSDIARH